MREDRQRLDKWLWFCRFMKTRSLAARVIAAGFVRINGVRALDPAKALALGDVVTLSLPQGALVVRVEKLGSRRGPAVEARELYADLSSREDVQNVSLVSGPLKD